MRAGGSAGAGTAARQSRAHGRAGRLAPRLKDDVEALAAIERRSAGGGEHVSAEWIARRLREAGAEAVRLEGFRYQHTFAWAHGLHYAAGVLGGRLTAAAALLSFELDYSGRSQWARRLLPAGEGANIVGRLPSSGPCRRTAVLVAHHDAAHTGLMWHPRLLTPGDALAARTHRRASLALLPEAALLVAALTRARTARRAALAALALATGLELQSAFAPTVAGANDNASGVAGLLALVERLRDDRPPGLEVIALAPGCEESGMGGMAAWLARHGGPLDARRTLVVGLDTIGSGTPVVLEAEGGLWPVRYREQDVLLAERAAARAGLPLRRWRLGAWTDPVLARLRGLPTVSILSVRDGGFPNYHLASDTPDAVDWRSAEVCIELAEACVRAW